jgi:hypothetical protein
MKNRANEFGPSGKGPIINKWRFVMFKNKAFFRVPSWGSRIAALVCAAFFVLFTIAGCNVHHNPVVGDDPENIFRIGQSFGSIENPDTGRALDSATTMWTYPLPDGVYAGDIVDTDALQFGTVDPRVTAFVWRDEMDSPAEIHLLLKDRNWDEKLDVTFSYDTALEGEVCRHPAVEVTYGRLEEESEVGVVRIHVVWAQLTSTDPVNNWDIYYRCYTYITIGTAINWANPSTTETVRLPGCSSSYSEIQPDICILASIDSLFAVCVVRDLDNDPQTVVAAEHTHGQMTDADDWLDAFPLSVTDSRYKNAPSIDGGFFTTTTSTSQSLLGNVAAVWNEMTTASSLDRYQVYYIDWHYQDEADPNEVIQLTEAETGGFFEHGLPKIDIPSFSSGYTYAEAVITWMSAYQSTTSPPTFGDYTVQITATPDVQTYNYTEVDGRYSRCPDVACYQGAITQQDHQLVGISYYNTEDMDNGPWLVSAKSFSFYINSGLAVFTEEESTYINGTDGCWGLSEDNIFTGSTLCLRDPLDPTSDPWSYQYFGLGWLDTSACDVGVSQGNIL